MSKNNRKSKSVSIDNINYHSMTDAERQLGISRKVIAKRIKDERYPNYKEINNEGLSDNKIVVNSRKSACDIKN